VIDVIPDAIYLKDTESRFLLANQAVADLMGASSPAVLIGRTDREFYPAEMASAYLAEEKELMEKGRPIIDKVEQEQFAGGMKWLEVTKLPVHDTEGRVTGLVGTARDFTERRRIEQTLRESEERYRSIFFDAPIGIFHSTLEGKLISVNPAFARMVGYDTPEQVIETVNTMSAAEILYEDAQSRPVLIEMLQREPGWHRTENRYRHRNGGVVVAQVTIRMHIPPGAAAPELEGFVEDITERTRAEQALSRERAFLTALMDNAPDYIYFKDLKSRFILNNRSHALALGAGNPSELLEKTDFDYFGPEHAQQAFADEQSIIRTGQPMVNALEEEGWPDRPPTWVSTTKMPLRNENGEIIGTFGISRSMTERRRMEEKNLRLAAMIESSHDAIIGVALDDTVTSWNKGAEKVFGYTAEEMVGRPITLLLSPDDEVLQSALNKKQEREGHVQQFESLVPRKDGTKVHVSTTFSSIQDANGLLVGITCISRDMTDQKALQAQIIRSQRLESLGTLAAGIAHQFNNINTAIMGYLDIMARDTTLSDATRTYVREALKAVRRATEITERIHGLTEGSSAAADPLQLEEVVPTLLPLFEERLQAGGISIRTDFQETSPVRAGQGMVGFIVTSLLTNSIHALLDCPSRLITLRTRSTGAFSSLEVSDTGCGILPQDLPRIFTPFFTTKGEWAGPKSPQARVDGVGLSLAVCQSTVSESGGWIEVESVPGQGTTFRVWLPAQPAAGAPQ
jgi:PAS domain S-box-containing protein